MIEIAGSEYPTLEARDGKVVFVVRLEVTPDGKTIHATSESKEDGSVKAWELHKRSK